MSRNTAREDAAEFTTAYYKSVSHDGSGHRTLVEYGGYKLAAGWKGSGIEFVTWRQDRGVRKTGHYFKSYREAKEEFAKRSGLIDENKVFDDDELLIIRAALENYVCMDTEKRGIIEKIDEVITPFNTDGK